MIVICGESPCEIAKLRAEYADKRRPANAVAVACVGLFAVTQSSIQYTVGNTIQEIQVMAPPKPQAIPGSFAETKKNCHSACTGSRAETTHIRRQRGTWPAPRYPSAFLRKPRSCAPGRTLQQPGYARMHVNTIQRLGILTWSHPRSRQTHTRWRRAHSRWNNCDTSARVKKQGSYFGHSSRTVQFQRQPCESVFTRELQCLCCRRNADGEVKITPTPQCNNVEQQVYKAAIS
jgi:hypothetical protein